MLIPDILKGLVKEWRENNYPSEYPSLSEILNFNYVEDVDGNKIPRYLRRAQIEALETYWYLRIVENTPLMKDLYQKLITDLPQLLETLEINLPQDEIIRLSSEGTLLENLFNKIKTDDDFVRKYNLETVRETLGLTYPSYILALAMGSGKTLLVGTIIAIEFALSFEYLNDFFIKNALVFAPGKTILGALKQISDIPFEKLLPSRFYKQFISSVKITYTRDGQKELYVTENSSYNVIITNTEKIRIQKLTGKKQTSLLNFKEREKIEQQEEIANLRLQTIASLPQLGIFSDEGHHTYGQSLDTGLKKVRMTVDYLAEKTNVICVINTTGTPYFKKQMLKDVIYWYGLSQGIQDGILKEVRDNVISYQNIDSKEFISKVIKDFFKNYRDITIHDGAKSKIAIYFPQTDYVDEALPIVEKTLLGLGEDPSTVLVVNSKSSEDTKDFFNNRINEVTNPYRVYLLVNMGTEGWNCPSLFSTALIRKLTTSNNFVLQAASRCLRQSIGNLSKAKIYLSKENISVLNNQLQETYGESLQTLNTIKQDMVKDQIIIRKTNLPPINLKRNVRKIVKIPNKKIVLKFSKPSIKSKTALQVNYEIKESSQTKKIVREKERKSVEIEDLTRDAYSIAVEFSSIFRMNAIEIYENLIKLYPEGQVPIYHIDKLKEQLEKQTEKWKIEEFEEDNSLAIIHPEGFEKETINGNQVYVSEISYKKTRSDYFVKYKAVKDENIHDFGFHYSPYNFDSLPEKDFLLNMLEIINENPANIEDIYFTGGLSSPRQTDLLYEYKNKDGDWKNYAPDYLIKKKDGKVLIIEIKKERLRDDDIEGENGLKAKALSDIEKINSKKMKYQMLFTDNSEIGFDNIDIVKKWMY